MDADAARTRVVEVLDASGVDWREHLELRS
jgi:hypothetical protein